MGSRRSRLSLLNPLVARPMKGASQRTKGRTMRSDRIVRPHVLFLTVELRLKHLTQGNTNG